MQHLKKLSFSIPLFLPYICCTYTRQIFWGDPFSEKHSALKERKKRSNNKSQITERAVVVAAMKRNCKRCNHLTILFASCCPQWFLRWTAVKWQLSCLLSAFGYSHRHFHKCCTFNLIQKTIFVGNKPKWKAVEISRDLWDPLWASAGQSHDGEQRYTSAWVILNIANLGSEG